MGASPAELRGARLVATDDLRVFAAARAHGRAVLTAPVVVPCGAGQETEIPRGATGTWLRLDASPAVEREARMFVARPLGPVPVRAVIGLGPDPGGAVRSLKLSCAGATSLIVEGATEAPVPGT
jgi:hypothetical protein